MTTAEATTTTGETTVGPSLVEELTQEAAATRRVLERVPEDRLSWAPHPKSMSLGQLALHVAVIPGALTELVSEPSREVPTFSPPEATSRDEILAAFEDSLATATAKLSAWPDEDLKAEWTMTRGAETLLALPRIGMLRSIMLNHWYHHRGQLVVYLRLLDVPVPPVYGPTADESPFAHVTMFTTPSERELVATRVVEAPRSLVWDAWTSPEHIPNWMLGPEGWTMPTCQVDLRPGGSWRFVWRRPDGTEMEMTGVYREIAPPERLVQTESWGGDWPDTLNTLVFTEDGGRTTMTCTILYPSEEARDAALGTGMTEGWSASYDRLDAHLGTHV